MDVLLVINAGSSSIKFGVYEAKSLEPQVRGQIEDIGDDTRLKVKRSNVPGVENADGLPKSAGHEGLVRWLLQHLQANMAEARFVSAGHRVVHGGVRFTEASLLDPDIMAYLATLKPLAPNHQPHNLAAIQAVMAEWPSLPQAACFDTAFHRSQPRLAQLFAIPRELTDEGIIRYGFHGLSYEYIASVLPGHAGARAEGRVIVAHLGHGASMCAMKGRKSVATTMGFTALDGLVMGKRCGDLDPGIVIYLMQQKGMSPDEVSLLLRKRSGLFGVSGENSDMRDLLASGSAEAEEAISLFVYRAQQQIGSLMASLGGLDMLVFTAGIGENSAIIRDRICSGLDWAGIELDGEANRENALRISKPDVATDVMVVPTNEELVIARAASRLCAA